MEISTMPKLLNRPPKYSKLKKYAVVYLHDKIHYLGLYGSEESKVAYARFIAESRANPTLLLPKGESAETGITVSDLAAAFLEHAEATLAQENYDHYRIVVRDFLLKLYGDGIPTDCFKPSCLKLVRSEMIASKRFCRKMINGYTDRIVRIFSWGVEEEYVNPNTALALKAVKSLPPGYAGTFDNEERGYVPDDVIRRTLPFASPTVRAMVLIQRLTGARPGEIFNMRVGEIDKTSDPDLWLYRLSHHKTEKKVNRKKIIPLGKPEQELLAPYLEGKKPEAAVFSPREAMAEWHTERRANRKTKLSPSQQKREQQRAEKPAARQPGEFYNRSGYRNAILNAIKKGNKVLPVDQQIPHWTPYMLRHSASSAMEVEVDFEASQLLLDHATPNTTARYNHRRLEKQKELARNRQNPFETEAGESAEEVS
jgi:integrase